MRRHLAWLISAVASAALWCVLLTGAQAQLPPGSGVTQSGAVIANDCVSWVGNNKIKDAGAPCGSGGSSSIIAGTTPTSGIASGDLIGSTGNLAVDSGVAWTNVPLKNGSNVYTGPNTFAEVIGAVTTQSGTTYTFASTDCGTEVVFTNAAAVTTTIPATLPAGCNISVLQTTSAGQVAVNGSAVTPATLHSAHSYTKTFGQWAVIGINIYTTGVAVLTGDGA